MGIATATIETMTAEVKTLQVGNRQVTLSVYRQLDKVSFDCIKPFGRVRDSQDKDENSLYIVGCDSAGNLVRSSLGIDDLPKVEVDVSDLIVVGARYLGNEIEMVNNSGLRFSYIFDDDIAKVCDLHSGCATWHWLSEDEEAETERWLRRECELSKHSKIETFRQWYGLPLIVLAGMR